MGLKGIQYVAKIATPFPLIPIAVLLILTASTIGGLGGFTPEKTYPAAPVAASAAEAPSGENAKAAEAATAQVNKLQPLGAGAVILATIACIVGFFATAGAAGVDISMNSSDEKNVQKGGLVGIALATVFSAGLSLVIVAGYYGSTANVPAEMAGKLDPIELMKGGILSVGFAKVLMILLAISSFPAACFSSFIAANSFKTVLPKVNPFLSVGLGAAGSCILAATGWAGNAAGVFGLIGASFGPVCGAMVADYLLAGKKWAGPRGASIWPGGSRGC